jgi:DNA-nicking Smr family endonuclease
MNDKHDKPDSKFAELMGDVRRMDSDKVDLHQQKLKATGIKPGKKRQPDDGFLTDLSRQRVSQIAGQWFDHGLNSKLRRRIKNGNIAIDASLDLHGYREADAKRELSGFLREAIARQCQFVLVIHGKGFRSESEAVLRPMVQDQLLQHPDVLAFCPAQPVDGGSGATYVYLRASRR